MTSESEKALIVHELRSNKDCSKIARMLGLPIRVVREVAVAQTGYFQASTDGRGRLKLRKYVIAERNIAQPWPVTDVIQAAHEAYDAGLVEICTGRDGFTQFLYCIPRKEPVKDREPYFSRNFGD